MPARITSIADIDLDLIRQERLRQGTFDDNSVHLAGRLVGVRVPSRPVHPRPAAGRQDIGLQTHGSSGFPFVPADPGAPRAGLFRGLQYPGLRPRAAPRRDRREEAP